jgi:DNA-binding Xre family transcriptional regulator
VVRLRIPEVLRERRVTPRELAALSAGRLAVSTVYRWVQLEGRLKSLDTQALDDLCDILGVEIAQVIEREPRRRERRQGL